MTAYSAGNRAASIRQRLLNLSRVRGEEFQRVLTRFALERLLHRLSLSAYREQFLLKGALLFVVWFPQSHRPTKDLDLAGYGNPSRETLADIFRSLCHIEGADDGMEFLMETVLCTEIREETEYGGLRIHLTATLGTAKIPLQVDIGFGDVVTPAPEEIVFPVLLDLPEPILRAYPKETVVAEKLEAMVSLELGNSRMKDFHDLWTLARLFPFEGEALAAAIAATFSRRNTPFPNGVPIALTEQFAEDTGKQTQWKAFCRRSVPRGTAPALQEVVALLATFLLPLLQAQQQQVRFHVSWTWENGWK